MASLSGIFKRAFKSASLSGIFKRVFKSGICRKSMALNAAFEKYHNVPLLKKLKKAENFESRATLSKNTFHMGYGIPK